jgi:hypothetical protein
MPSLQPKTPFPVATVGLVAVPLPGERWRLTRADGAVLGYIERTDDRYRALRMLPRRTELTLVAEVARADDAVELLRG